MPLIPINLRIYTLELLRHTIAVFDFSLSPDQGRQTGWRGGGGGGGWRCCNYPLNFGVGLNTCQQRSTIPDFERDFF